MRFYTNQHPFYQASTCMPGPCMSASSTRAVRFCASQYENHSGGLSESPCPVSTGIVGGRVYVHLVLARRPCADEGIPFVLGHALYMKAIHGGKAKNDKIDSHKIAALLRGGMLPQASVYPAQRRATRDLLRRRMHLARKRAELLAHAKYQ